MQSSSDRCLRKMLVLLPQSVVALCIELGYKLKTIQEVSLYQLFHFSIFIFAGLKKRNDQNSSVLKHNLLFLKNYASIISPDIVSLMDSLLMD